VARLTSDETHFDAIIVGSGFGGSVMAYRLAQAGLRTCLLERGRAYPPGAFPRSPYRMRTNLWDPSEGMYGLFNIWSFRGLGSVISSGLGGGSLIYANVLLRKDERWFVKEDLERGGYEYWPVTRADLDPHYARAERMLGARPYPFADSTPKTVAFRRAGEQLGLDWFLPNLAITFGNDDGREPVPGEPIVEDQPNLHGRTRYTCRLCGECDIGCNYGSKNTLDYTYLSQAQRLGAELRTLCEVRSFAPRAEGGYRVDYVRHELARAGRRMNTRALPLETITADRLVLSAGTYGSTFLLLKNRPALPRISRLLGTRFCGNGDLLTFAIGRDRGAGPALEAGVGPVITGAVRMPDRADGGLWRGFYVEDAGYPGFVDWMVEAGEAPGALWKWRDAALAIARHWLHRQSSGDLSRAISRLLGNAELSANLLPLLGMGRDIPNGRMRLAADGKLDVDWSIDESEAYFNAVRSTMQSIAAALGTRFQDNPTWHLSRVTTVHPLGGCPMGRHEQEGVVDPYGQVFNYPGLYVADGSVMPGPVGANPSLTIAALADRFADAIVERRSGVTT
jgi:cholesterol oxidase